MSTTVDVLNLAIQGKSEELQQASEQVTRHYQQVELLERKRKELLGQMRDLTNSVDQLLGNEQMPPILYSPMYPPTLPEEERVLDERGLTEAEPRFTVTDRPERVEANNPLPNLSVKVEPSEHPVKGQPFVFNVKDNEGEPHTTGEVLLRATRTRPGDGKIDMSTQLDLSLRDTFRLRTALDTYLASKA